MRKGRTILLTMEPESNPQGLTEGPHCSISCRVFLHTPMHGSSPPTPQTDLCLPVPTALPPSPLLSSGILYVNGSLDFETHPKYFLSIECSRKSSSSLSDVTTIVINITDVNEHHPRFTHDLYTVRVLENAIVGDVILTVRTPASLSVGCGLWGRLLFYSLMSS